MNITLTEDELKLLIEGLNCWIAEAEGPMMVSKAARLKQKLRDAIDMYTEKEDPHFED